MVLENIFHNKKFFFSSLCVFFFFRNISECDGCKSNKIRKKNVRKSISAHLWFLFLVVLEYFCLDMERAGNEKL